MIDVPYSYVQIEKPNAHLIHGYVLVLGCKQDKVNNLITLSKLEQVDLKQQQKSL